MEYNKILNKEKKGKRLAPTRRRVLSGLLALCLLLSCVNAGGLVAYAQTPEIPLGEGVSAQIATGAETMTVSGTGAATAAPVWSDYSVDADAVTTLLVDEGVSAVESGVFADFTALQQVVLSGETDVAADALPSHMAGPIFFSRNDETVSMFLAVENGNVMLPTFADTGLRGKGTGAFVWEDDSGDWYEPGEKADPTEVTEFSALWGSDMPATEEVSTFATGTKPGADGSAQEWYDYYAGIFADELTGSNALYVIDLSAQEGNIRLNVANGSNEQFTAKVYMQTADNTYTATNPAGITASDIVVLCQSDLATRKTITVSTGDTVVNTVYMDSINIEGQYWYERSTAGTLVLLDGADINVQAGDGMVAVGKNNNTADASAFTITCRSNYASVTEHTCDESCGTLTARGVNDQVAIGCPKNQAARCKNLTIAGGNIIAYGGDSAPAIGVGANSANGLENFQITGGNITAYAGGENEPAIGIDDAESDSKPVEITITGGTVNALTKSGAAGAIGTPGDSTSTSTITITGGDITASTIGTLSTVTEQVDNSTYAKATAKVTISGGNVTATKIGHASHNAMSRETAVTISGGNVSAPADGQLVVGGTGQTTTVTGGTIDLGSGQLQGTTIALSGGTVENGDIVGRAMSGVTVSGTAQVDVGKIEANNIAVSGGEVTADSIGKDKEAGYDYAVNITGGTVNAGTVGGKDSAVTVSGENTEVNATTLGAEGSTVNVQQSADVTASNTMGEITVTDSSGNTVENPNLEEIIKQSPDIIFDLSKGPVSITETGWTGWFQGGDGTEATKKTGAHSAENTYTIKQSDNTTATANTITINSGASADLTVYLDGVNVETAYNVAPMAVNEGSGHTTIVLRNENTLRAGSTTEADKDDTMPGLWKQDKGTLTITCEGAQNDENHVCSTSCGGLNATGGSASNVAASGIGIGGGIRNTSAGTCRGLTIAGGQIHAIGGSVTSGISGPGIGTGTFGDNAQITITGGIITADAGTMGSSAAVQSPDIGAVWGAADITITGGTVNADVIGVTGYKTSTAPTATVKVSGGIVNANTIGAAATTEDPSSDTARATVEITGGDVTAARIGNANHDKSSYSTVTISGGNVTMPTEGQLIIGGMHQTVTISGGNVNTGTGNVEGTDIHLTGGTIAGKVSGRGNSTVNVQDPAVLDVESVIANTINISGGDVTAERIGKDSEDGTKFTVNITGGTVNATERLGGKDATVKVDSGEVVAATIRGENVIVNDGTVSAGTVIGTATFNGGTSTIDEMTGTYTIGNDAHVTIATDNGTNNGTNAPNPVAQYSVTFPYDDRYTATGADDAPLTGTTQTVSAGETFTFSVAPAEGVTGVSVYRSVGTIMQPMTYEVGEDGAMVYSFRVQEDTDLVFVCDGRVALDLRLYDVTINTGSVTFDHATLSSYTGEFLLTTGGEEASGHTLTVNGTAKVKAAKLKVTNDGSTIHVGESGDLELQVISGGTWTSHTDNNHTYAEVTAFDNILTSRNGAPIYLAAEGRIYIMTNVSCDLKLVGQDYAIDGQGYIRYGAGFNGSSVTADYTTQGQMLMAPNKVRGRSWQYNGGSQHQNLFYGVGETTSSNSDTINDFSFTPSDGIFYGYVTENLNSEGYLAHPYSGWGHFTLVVNFIMPQGDDPVTKEQTQFQTGGEVNYRHNYSGDAPVEKTERVQRARLKMISQEFAGLKVLDATRNGERYMGSNNYGGTTNYAKVSRIVNANDQGQQIPCVIIEPHRWGYGTKTVDNVTTTYFSGNFNGYYEIMLGVEDTTAADTPMTYDAKNVSFPYDGLEHVYNGLTVYAPATGYTVTYSTDSTDGTDGNWAATLPTATNVTDTKTFWYRVTADGYKEVTGQATLTITAATDNVWLQKLSCPAATSSHPPVATAQAKYGTDTIVYSYYKAAGFKGDGSDTPVTTSDDTNFANYWLSAAVGDYIVVATMPENANYNSLSDQVRFSLSRDYVFDVSRGSVSITETAYDGYSPTGQHLTGGHTSGKVYTITGTTLTNSVTIDSGTSGNITVYLDGVDITGTTSDAPMLVKGTGSTYVVLKDGTANTLQATGTKAGLQKESSGIMVVACEAGYADYLSAFGAGHVTTSTYTAYTHVCDGSCGALNAGGNTGEQVVTPGAGIGGEGGIAADAAIQGMVFAGGNITATGGRKYEAEKTECYHVDYGAAAIGSGAYEGNRKIPTTTTSITILGGNITAYDGSYTAACIGTGAYGGAADITIYGGVVNAMKRYTGYDGKLSAGIGNGGGGNDGGNNKPATVTIYGGTITAESDYGAAIGGSCAGIGESNGTATVTIYGGTINATTHGTGAAIGNGGSTGSGTAALATVTISGGIINASSGNGIDIGGGSSKSGAGGSAHVNITGGFINATTGGIGGGSSDTGNGGSATVNISGGTVKAATIGGGLSAATNAYASATITIAGGSVNAPMTVTPVNAGGAQVTRSMIAVYNNGAAVANSAVSVDGITNYGMTDVRTDADGKLYFWLAGSNGAPTGGTVTTNGYGMAFSALALGGNNYALTAGATGNLFYTVKIPYDDRYTVTDESGNRMEGINTVLKDSEMKLIYRRTSENVVQLLVYRSTKETGGATSVIYIDGSNGQPLDNEEEATFTVDHNMSLYAITKYQETGSTASIQSLTQRMSLDLSLYDISVTDDPQYPSETQPNIRRQVVTLGGYTISSYAGEFLLTSGGIATNHTLTIGNDVQAYPEGGSSGKRPYVGLYIDQLTVTADQPVITVGDNTQVNVTASTYNNSITSTAGPAIMLGDFAELTVVEGARNLAVKGTGDYAIAGDGILEYSNDGQGKLTLSPAMMEGKSLFYTGDVEFDADFTASGNGILLGYKYNKSETYTETYTKGWRRTIVVDFIMPANSESVTYEKDNGDSATTDNAILRYKDSQLDGHTIASYKNYNMSGWATTLTATFDDATDTATVEGSINGYHQFVMTKEETVTVGAKDVSFVYDTQVSGETILPVKRAFNGVSIVAYNGATYDATTNALKIQYKTTVDGTFGDDAPVLSQVQETPTTVYWQVVKVDGGTTLASGNNTFQITQATNAWTVVPTIASVEKYGTLAPQGEAKYSADVGSKVVNGVNTPYAMPTFTYYQSDRTTEIAADKVTKTAGIYYMKATVAQTENHTGLELMVPFEVIDSRVYGKVDETIQRFDLLASGEKTLTLDDQETKFSVFATFARKTGEITLNTTAALPEGSSVIMMDFTGGKRAFYGYTVGAGGTKTIALSAFTALGGEAAFAAPAEKTQVAYQFCVTLPVDQALSGSLSVKQGTTNVDSALRVTKTAGTPPVTSGVIVAENGVAVSGSDLTVNFTTPAMSGGEKVLLRLVDGDGTPVELFGATVRQSGVLKATKVTSGYVLAKGLAGTTEGSVTFQGLPMGTYHLESAVLAADADESHPLGRDVVPERAAVGGTVAVAKNPVLSVTTVAETRVVMPGDTLSFNIQALNGGTTVSYQWQKKVNGSYQNMGEKQEITGLTLDNGVYGISSASVSVPEDAVTENTTYRILFTYDGAEMAYNVIVTPTASA